MKRHFIFFFLLFVTSNLAAKEADLVLKTPSGEIKGTLSLPDKEEGIPVVLIISGSGPTDRNGNQPGLKNNSLQFFADELRKNQIASVRFDKRGVGESGKAIGKESDLRFDHYIEDVKAWVELLSKDKRFSKIIVAGHSEGSLIGMVASEKNNHVSKFISIAGPGRPIDEVIKEQLSTQPQTIKDAAYHMLDKLKKGETVFDVPQSLYSLFRPSVQPYMISWMKYNPQEEIKKLTIPVLIIQGSTDIQVLEKDAQLLAQSQPKAQLKIIENMNHVLKDCNSVDKKIQMPVYSNPELPLNKNFVTEVVQFIQKLN